MLLRDFLEKADKGTTYFIGGGSGYLAIGAPDAINLNDLSEQERHKLALAVHDAEKDVETAKNRLEQAEHAAVSARRKLKEFIPFAEREVTETYLSPCYGNHCVIIQGKENGEFWTEKEVEIRKNALLITNKIMNALKDLMDAEGLSEKNAAAEIAECLSQLKHMKIKEIANEH